jgi:hypothetical protein
MGTISGVNGTGAATGAAPVDASTSTNGSGAFDPPSLLPEPVYFGGNIVIELAMLMTRADAQERDNATRLEDLADVAAAKDNADRVTEMMHKADDDAASGWATGLGEIAGGAASIGGACFDNKAGLDMHDVLAGLSEAAPGIGKLVAAGYKAGADRDDAGAAKFQALADADLRLYGRAQNDAQSATQAMQQVQQYLQGILSTNAATNSAATGYRG